MTIALLRFLVTFYVKYLSPLLFHDLPLLARWFLSTIPRYPLFYLLATVVLYAGFRGHAHATVISPFHLPPQQTLPFSGATAANSLQDAFGEIRNEAEAGLRKRSGKLVGIAASELAGLKLPEFTQFETPTRFAVEIKGLSHEALVSVARKVWKTERVISGDVVVHDGNFRLLARSNDAGPWMSVPRAITLDSIRQASRELALEMLADFDPALLAAYELAGEKVEAAHKRLLAVVSKPEASETAKRVFEVAAVLASSNLKEQAKEAASRELLEAASRLLPKSALLAFNLGLAWQQSNEPEALANGIASYQRALRLRPNFPEGLSNLGVALDDKGRTDEAITAYRKALELKPDDPKILAGILNNLGTALLEKGRTDDAIEYYQKAIAARPNFPEALNNLGVALKQKGRIDEAIEYYQKAIAARRDYAKALFNLGLALAEKGQTDEAIEYFKKAIAARRDYAKAHYNLGSALRKTGREDEAEREFAEAQRLDPKLKPPG